MAAMAAIFKIYFSLLLQNQKANRHETWLEASVWLVDKEIAKTFSMGNPSLKSIFRFFSWNERSIVLKLDRKHRSD